MRFPALKTACVRFDSVALGLCFSSLFVCCLIALHAAWRWPMVGDASLIHYVVFLMHSGRAPYSQIVEINLPGSYLLEYLAMHVFGWGAHGLRLYDGFLCVALCWSAYLLGGTSRRESLFCLAGGMVFVLIHLQDGLDQAGQRDFALAVLVLSAISLLSRAARPGLATIFFYELLIGFTLTIKPTLAPFALLPLVVSGSIDAKTFGERVWLVAGALAGLGTPVALGMLWLWHFHSLRSFVEVMRSIGVLHSELGRKSLGFLLAHCTAPAVVVFMLCVCAFAAARPRIGKTEKLLLWGVVLGLLSYLDQGKGFPYQRYPFLAVALVFTFLVFSRASSLEGLPYAFSLGGLLYASLWLAPRFAASVRSFDAVAPFQEALGRDLIEAGGGGVSIQCLDTYGGCVNTLYDLRIQQATGYLYDCYLFGGESRTRDLYRTDFLRAFQAARPRFVVLTNERCFDPRRSFDRVDEWPEFKSLLARDYVPGSAWQSQRLFRSWSRAQVPNAYEVYVRR